MTTMLAATDWGGVLTGIALIITAGTGVYNAYMLRVVHKTTNSLADKRVAEAGQAGEARGKHEERDRARGTP